MKKIALVLLIAVFSKGTIGEVTSQEPPKKIINVFALKYPGARLKNWKIRNGDYVGEFILNKKKYNAFYSQDAHWLKTESKVRWTWNLPPEVKKAFFNSEYASWAINGIKEIVTPAGPIYSISVNDGNLMDADHYYVFKQDMLIYFKSNGELEKSIAVN